MCYYVGFRDLKCAEFECEKMKSHLHVCGMKVRVGGITPIMQHVEEEEEVILCSSHVSGKFFWPIHINVCIWRTRASLNWLVLLVWGGAWGKARKYLFCCTFWGEKRCVNLYKRIVSVLLSYCSLLTLSTFTIALPSNFGKWKYCFKIFSISLFKKKKKTPAFPHFAMTLFFIVET